MRRALTLLAAALLADPDAALPSQPADEAAAELAGWQAKEARLFGIGWRLVTGNAPFCADAAPALGLLLHDTGSYAEPERVRAALGLRGPLGVQAVAAGSPAEGAGLKVNDTLVSANGTAVSTIPLDAERPWGRLARIHAVIDESLRQDGRAALRWRSSSGEETMLDVHGTPACPSRFELLSGDDQVVADGTRVLLGQEFAGFTYPDDLLAAAIAHELAHNLLGHRARLDRIGRSQRNVRATEREADRMMPWLLANAGYPPQAAADFMRRWGPSSTGGQLGGLLRARSHDGWDERIELIEGELPVIALQLAAKGRADWRTRFPTAAP